MPQDINRSLHRWWVGTWVTLWICSALVVVPHNLDPSVTAWSRFSFYDFRDTTWMPIHDFRQGHLPWDTDAYLIRHPGVQDYVAYIPSYWWIVAPFMLLPYPVVVALWLGVTTASLVALVSLGLCWTGDRFANQKPWLLPLFTVGVLTLRPVKSALLQGQWALPCALGAMYALWRVGNTRGRLGCTMLALVKPPVGLPLIGILTIIRHSRMVLLSLFLSFGLCVPIGISVAQRAGGLDNAFRLALATLAHGSGMSPNELTYVDLRGAFTSLPCLNSSAWQVVAVILAVLITLPASRFAYLQWGQRDTRFVAITSLTLVLITPTLLYALVAMIPVCILLLVESIRHPKAILRSALTALLWLPMVLPQGILEHAKIGIQGDNILNSASLAMSALLINFWIWQTRKEAID